MLLPGIGDFSKPWFRIGFRGADEFQECRGSLQPSVEPFWRVHIEVEQLQQVLVVLGIAFDGFFEVASRSTGVFRSR
jgi:hypothetical protein